MREKYIRRCDTVSTSLDAYAVFKHSTSDVCQMYPAASLILGVSVSPKVRMWRRLATTAAYGGAEVIVHFTIASQ